MQVIEIEWLDSQGFSEWQSKEVMEDWSDSLVCHSVGYLLRQDENRVVIIQSESFTSYGEGLMIPKISIVKMNVLRE